MGEETHEVTVAQAQDWPERYGAPSERIDRDEGLGAGSRRPSSLVIFDGDQGARDWVEGLPGRSKS